MKSDRDSCQEQVLLIALAQLGKAVDTMQDLLSEMELLLHSQRHQPEEDEGSLLTQEIPEDRTVH
jgi:hypothetical protein